MTRRPILTACLAAAALPALADDKGEVSSVYTSLDLAKCRQVETRPASEGGGAVWHCRGHEGMRVRVAEGDLRFFVSYGPGAERQTAATQTLPQFNTIHTTLEWRVERRGGRWVPFATILRYFWDSGDGGARGETLVITRLGAHDACHMAYVHADANPLANDIARSLADSSARNHACSAAEVLEQMPGRSVPAN